MIATGGLLRINRRQDSLRSKSHKARPHKKKRKRRNEVVVVKGKLKLVSVSGFVAALGIMVLLGGVVMAALGYWPREGLFISTQPQEGAAMASVSSSSPSPAADDEQGGGVREELQEDKADKEDERGNIDGFNQTGTVNGTTSRPPRGFLEDFLHRYLYSDRLKVFGPLIMGIGIFLFICANAVLHENRDKKTKLINLRDIYSTVIDLHSLRKPNASSSVANPLNGLVNYVQSKSLETKPRAYPASLSRKEVGGGGGGGGGDVIPLSKGGGDGSQDNGGGEEGDPVFSIFQDQQASPPLPPSSHRLSLPPSFSRTQLSLQKEVLTSSTLPLRHPRPNSPCRRHSDQEGSKRDYLRNEGEVNACPLPQNSSAASCSSSSLHREVPSGPLSHLLSSPPTPPPPAGGGPWRAGGVTVN